MAREARSAGAKKQAAARRGVSRRTGKRAAAATQKRRRPRKPTREHAAEVYRRLQALYPDAHCELDFNSPYQLLVATILSAQCTDKQVNLVTPALFAKYPDAQSLAAARPEELESIIRSTGFFRSKTRSLLGMSAAVTDSHDGTIPDRMEDLVKLPGVGRKTANVVLGNAFDTNEGVVVDTHVARVGARLGLHDGSDPLKIENQLMELYDRNQWTMLSHLLIWHGRRICVARRPRCEECPLNDICPSSLV